MKVTVRTKPISKGRLTIYLDFYPPIASPDTGKPTRREFLDLFLYSEIEYEEQDYLDKKGNPKKKYVPVLKKGEPKTVRLEQLEKQHNSETLHLADTIKAKRQLQIQADDYGFFKKQKGNEDFLSFAKKLAEKHKATKKGDKNNWLSVYNYLEKFTQGKCLAKDVTEDFCTRFKDFLITTHSFRSNKKTTEKTLANNSAVGYFNIFKRIVKKANETGLLEKDFGEKVPVIKKEETRRGYLTIEELQKLAATECDLPYLKNAALFSALTALRYGDIEKLTWEELEGNEKTGYQIRFQQEKTKGEETLPISQEAYSLLGTRSRGIVFSKLLYSAWQNMKLQEWVYRAEIYKKITFHSFRHTFATGQLTLGTDIYTVSKMLGHRDLKTTQVYAKIIDKTKREASEKIKLFS